MLSRRAFLKAAALGAARRYFEPERETRYGPTADIQRLVRDLLGPVRLVG